MNVYAYKDIFDFNVRWTWKTITLLAFLAVFPNVLGLVHTTVFGVRVHFFQYLIFLAAIIYGPAGGMVSGAFGSVYTAAALGNPYVIIGNVILGGVFGVLIRLKWHVISAVLTAYLIQMPWLWVTDVYLAGMPVKVVNGIVIALLISDVLWAVVAGWSSKYVSKHLNIRD
ncbi:hypothetical protein KY366_01910 [Candidatus Woesearchaeota archaeon]|nr:hypothetical protein [Candidatus Woesearchaeota archaeon]